jgi:glutamate 5-kinase
VDKKIVIKIRNNAFDLKQLANQVCRLQKKEIRVVLVVSDAGKVDSLAKKAAAGIEQIHLMSEMAHVFSKHKLRIAQVLVTTAQLELYKENIKDLLLFYRENHVIPVINENDVVDLNTGADNDLLAREVTKLLKLDHILTYDPQDTELLSVRLDGILAL